MARRNPPRGGVDRGGREPGHAPSCRNGAPGISNSGTVGHLLLPYATKRRRLSIKEARFVTEFLKDMDADAGTLAKRAGFSKKTAMSIGCQVIKRPHVQAEIRDQLHAFVQRERLSIQRLVRHLIELAEVDKREFIGRHGELRDIKELTKTQAALINGFTVSEIWGKDSKGDRIQIGELKKMTFTDHLKPIQMLAKSLQGFVDKVEVKGDISQTGAININHNHNIQMNFSQLTTKELRQLKAIHSKMTEQSREANAREVEQIQ